MTSQVLVVGSVNVDEAIRLARFPGPGETVSSRSLEESLGGKGANQAVAAARAGGSVRMVGAVGASDGDRLIDALVSEEIETSGIARLAGAHSGRAVVMIDDHGENSIVVVPGANARVPGDQVREACALLGPGDLLLLQQEIPPAVSRLAADCAHWAGATVAWNAAPVPTSVDDLVPGVDLLLVNEYELVAVAALLGVEGTGTSVISDVARAMDADVICTRGADGATYVVDGTRGSMPARRVQPVDTTAAGDTFVGYFAALSDLELVDRLRSALGAATLTVTRPGAAQSIPHRGEVFTLDAVTPKEPRT